MLALLHRVADSFVLALNFGLVARALWIALVVAVLVYAACAFERRRLSKLSGGLPGPDRSELPAFVGGVLQMVREPARFWHTAFGRGPISWTALGTKLVVIVADAAAAKSVFMRCSDRMPLCLSLNSKPLLGKDNFAFMNGPAHRTLRASLLPLFSQRCLNLYLVHQVESIREHLAAWAEERTYSEQAPMMTRFNCLTMNASTSYRAFLGPHLSAQERSQLAEEFATHTAGMFTLPINLPGSALYAGVQARGRILGLLERAVTRAKAAVDAEPSCLLDLWMRTLFGAGAPAADTPAVSDADAHASGTDRSTPGLAKVLLDFLFAAQDASTSSLTWLTHFVSLHPEVRGKVRAEVRGLHEAQRAAEKAQDSSAAVTPLRLDADAIRSLKYCAQVVRETLRICPPATLVPHMTQDELTLHTATQAVPSGRCPMSGSVAPLSAVDAAPKGCPFAFNVPAGSVVVPSVWAANREGWVDPEKFDPERFAENAADAGKPAVAEGHFLTFGAGPHACMGYRYAQQQLTTYLALLCHDYDFERVHTDGMHKIAYAPTIYPEDGVPLKMFQRRVQPRAVSA